jgi:UDP-2,3-diacylglucosamine pyrophosphatase LpxH
MKWCSEKYEKVFYIIGNHESYNFSMKETLLFVKENLKKFDNIFFLEKGVIVELEDYKVVGCTLWTELDHQSAEYLNDTKMIENDNNPYIPISIADIRNMHKNDKKWIEDVLNELGEKVIVMTHHLPSEICVDDKYKNSKFKKGFVADIDDLTIRKSKLWIFGHTHCHKDIIINGKTRLYANPHGYKGEESNFVLETLTL